MIPDQHNILIIKLTRDTRRMSFASAKLVPPPDSVEEFPKPRENDFGGFVDMLRIDDGDMVGIRFYFFEEFEEFSIFLDDIKGVDLTDSHLDLWFADHEIARTAQPNGEQLLGGLSFFITEDGEVTACFDFSHLSEGCRKHLKEAIENDYKDLGE